MEWKFTPAQVVKGEAQYDLEAFRSDLAREVAANLQGAHADEFERVYALVYDLCYWLATGKPLANLLASFDDDPATRDWLAAIEPHMRGNVDMLGALLQRDIMDEVAAGTPLSEALHAVAARNEDLARTAPSDQAERR